MSWGDKMNIDLKPLYNRSKEDINISGKYTIPKDYFANNKDVIAINDILVDGYIYLDEEDMLWAKLNITGKIDLKDSISLEDVKYPIKIEFDDMIEENYKKDLKKRIDDILDYFKLEPDNKENRQNLSIVLKKLLEEEKNLNKSEELKSLLLRHKGKDETYLWMKREGNITKIKLDRKYWVTPSKSLINDVEALLGEDTIKIR